MLDGGFSAMGGFMSSSTDHDNPNEWFVVPPGEVRKLWAGELDWSYFENDPKIYLDGHVVGHALHVFPNGGLTIKIDNPMVRAAFRAKPEPLWATGDQQQTPDNGPLRLVVRCLMLPDGMCDIDPFLLAVGDRLREVDTGELDQWVRALTAP